MREELLKGFMSGKMKPLAYRKEQIAKLAYMVHDNADEFRQAMSSDLGRDFLETDLCAVPFYVSHLHVVHSRCQFGLSACVG